MNFDGFLSKDFDVFQIPGLEARMEALIMTIRPKLTYLGEKLAPHLSELTGVEMVPHVAQHARRTVHPPNDTWVAWANNRRGYKKHPHFQVGLWQTHLFVWFALIYESPNKSVFAGQALREVKRLLAEIPDNFVWSVDHTKPEVIPHQSLSARQLRDMLQRLKKVKKAELLCGIQLDRHHPSVKDGEALEKQILSTFQTLLPLFQLAQPR